MGTQPVSATLPADIPPSEETVNGVDPSPEEATRPSGVVSTRASRTWVKVLPSLLLLAIVLIFVFQNLRSTKVHFVTASGALPLALLLLGAAACGGLSVLALGSVRILQLRKVIRRSHGKR
jgi:uncharacterized integral membrane protein